MENPWLKEFNSDEIKIDFENPQKADEIEFIEVKDSILDLEIIENEEI